MKAEITILKDRLFQIESTLSSAITEAEEQVLVPQSDVWHKLQAVLFTVSQAYNLAKDLEKGKYDIS